MPLSRVPYQLDGGVPGADVEGDVVEAGQDAGLLEVVERRRRARRRRRRSAAAPVMVKNLARLMAMAWR